MKEVGSRTRRRPIGRDYAAAKDAEVGNWNEEVEKLKIGSCDGKIILENRKDPKSG